MKLKPCPFCGATAKIVIGLRKRPDKYELAVKCDGCGAMLKLGTADNFSSDEEAHRYAEVVWNRRSFHAD